MSERDVNQTCIGFHSCFLKFQVQNDVFQNLLDFVFSEIVGL